MSKTDPDNANDPRRDDAHDESDEDHAHDAADDTNADERSLPPQLWLAAACVCLLAAAVLWLSGNADAAFVVAALGVLAWFFNVRAQLKKK